MNKSVIVVIVVVVIVVVVVLLVKSGKSTPPPQDGQNVTAPAPGTATPGTGTVGTTPEAAPAVKMTDEQLQNLLNTVSKEYWSRLPADQRTQLEEFAKTHTAVPAATMP